MSSGDGTHLSAFEPLGLLGCVEHMVLTGD